MSAAAVVLAVAVVVLAVAVILISTVMIINDMNRSDRLMFTEVQLIVGLNFPVCRLHQFTRNS